MMVGGRLTNELQRAQVSWRICTHIVYPRSGHATFPPKIGFAEYHCQARDAGDSGASIAAWPKACFDGRSGKPVV